LFSKTLKFNPTIIIMQCSIWLYSCYNEPFNTEPEGQHWTNGYILSLVSKTFNQQFRVQNNIFRTFSQHWTNIYQITFVSITICQRWPNVDVPVPTVNYNQPYNLQPTWHSVMYGVESWSGVLEWSLEWSLGVNFLESICFGNKGIIFQKY